MLSDDILLLRAAEPEDLDCFYRWENDTNVWNTGNTLVPYSRFTLRQYIETAGTDFYETRQMRLVIVERATGTAIGLVDLYDFEPHHRRAGVGILIDASHRNNGYASRALNLLKDYAFYFLNLQQLYAVVPADNLPSLSLFESAAYKQTGILSSWLQSGSSFRDVAVFQLLNPDR